MLRLFNLALLLELGIMTSAFSQTPVVPYVQDAPVSELNPLPFKSGTYVSAGFGQYGINVTIATALVVPHGATIAQICVETGNVRYRDDGYAPTAATGIPVRAGTCFQYAGPLSAIKFIAQDGSPTISVSYYK